MPKVVPQYKEEAKERIIQAALEVYSEKGYHEATMEDIAQKLGVSKGALYLYFKSKDELLNVIIERWDRRMRNILPSSTEGKELDRSLDEMYNHIAEDPIGRMGFGFELISLASRNPSIRKTISEAYAKNLKITSEFLKKTNTTSNSSEATSQAIGLVALQFGLMATLILGIDEKDARKAWEHSTRAIVSA